MIKLVYCITKKPGLSDEAFFHYWQDVHGPIGARIPGLRKLVQSHTIPGVDPLRPADYDWMAELWFDDLQTLLTARNTAKWQASTEDEKHFIDESKVAFFITEEHKIV